LLPLRRLWWLLLIPAIVAIAGGADYIYRCTGAPLTREEAIVRAEQRLDRYRRSFNVHEKLNLVETSFDQDTKAWLFTYTGLHCSVIIVVDRCHGDDVGSTNACTG
jgi:hypothetical protein